MRFLKGYLVWDIRPGGPSHCKLCGVEYVAQEIPHIWSHGLRVFPGQKNGEGLPNIYQVTRVIR